MRLQTVSIDFRQMLGIGIRHRRCRPFHVIVQRCDHILNRIARQTEPARLAIIFHRPGQFLQAVFAGQVELAGRQGLRDSVEHRAIAIGQQARAFGDGEHHLHQAL